MNAAGWKELVLEAVRRHEQGDDKLIDLLSRLLAEQDKRNNEIREREEA